MVTQSKVIPYLEFLNHDIQSGYGHGVICESIFLSPKNKPIW